MNIFQEAKQILDKDGKVNALGPYGKMKLTGSEVASYFRKNKVSDPEVKKAVEVALDLGGAYDVARKEIAKFFGDKILKTKEVQQALRFANEETVSEANLQEVALDQNMLQRQFPNVWATKDSKVFRVLWKQMSLDGYVDLKKDYEKDKKAFVDSLRQVAKNPKKYENIYGRNFAQFIEKPRKDQAFSEEISEGTMAIGIFDNNPSEKKKAIAGMQKLLKGKRNVKVGSPEGQKIGKELDLKYLSDDELADDFARPSNKNMTIQDLMKKHEKRFNIKFEEKESVMDSYRKMWEDAEQVDEGKYKKYADLLIKKADMLKKGMDTMQVDKELDKEFENITGKRAVKGHSFRD